MGLSKRLGTFAGNETQINSLLLRNLTRHNNLLIY
jgi:hypothetical protein